MLSDVRSASERKEDAGTLRVCRLNASGVLEEGAPLRRPCEACAIARQPSREERMACAAEVADFQARIFALEQALALERSRHVEHLREIASAAGLREVQAAGLLASQGSESTPNGGGPPSPTDSEGSSTGGAPPPGAQEPARSAPATPVARKSKAEAWLERAKKANAGVPTLSSGSSESSRTSVQETSAGSSPGAASGKMGRWLNRVQGEPAGTPTPAASKIDRWLARQGKPPASNGSASSSWGGGSATNPFTPDHDTSIEEEQRLLSRIKDAWAKLDGVIHLVGNLQNRDKGRDVVKGRSCGTREAVCQKCGAQQPGSPRPTSAHEHWVGGSVGGGTQMGLRMEAKSRGLTVTHVVPGGQADQAGLEVKDVIKLVNGQKVSSLKVFGKMCQVSGDVVMLEVIRGTGPQHKSMTLYSRTRPRSPSKGGEEAGEEVERDGGVVTQEGLAEAYNKQRAADGERAGQGQWRGQAALNVKKKMKTVFNRYGKDTQLWVPDSDESGALVAAAAGDGPNSKKGGSGGEPGGFFMFPPGHPDYVPLPPGEAALIAGVCLCACVRVDFCICISVCANFVCVCVRLCPAGT